MAQVDILNFDEYDDKGFLKLNTNKKYPKVDNLYVEKLLGHHWKGEQLKASGMDSIYLVNVKTGEYFTLGDYKGQVGMTDHVGLLWRIESVTDGTAVKNARFPNDTQTPFHIVTQSGHNTGRNVRFLGRQNFSDGQIGNFEYNRYLGLRDKKEYQVHVNSHTDPGGFVWYFHPVKEDPNDGYHYIIYTHRQTRIYPAAEQIPNYYNDNDVLRIREYANRESYLCLSSVDGNSVPGQARDYNNVRFKKFAGQMFYEEGDTIRYANMPNGGEYQDVDPAVSDWAADQVFIVKKTDNWKPMEDEVGKNKFVDLESGLVDLANDEANLWKIVTFKERKAYRVTASEEHPVDVTFNISNNKFFTSYDYAVEDTVGGFTRPSFDWQWFDKDENNPKGYHAHPYKTDVGTAAGQYNEKDEFHKVGTGYYYCFSHGIADEHGDATHDYLDRNRQHEQMMTEGHDGNFCGTIYNGSAVLEQKITGLRPGNYIVYARAFFAPHSMMNYSVNSEGTPYLRTGDDIYAFNEAEAKAAINAKKMSHDSYLFAWSIPNGTDTVEYKRRLPSIYEGLTPYTDEKKKTLSKETFMASEEFKYNQLGFQYKTNPTSKMYNVEHRIRYNALKDSTVFAKIPGSWVTGGTADSYIVPRTVSGAGRFFNAIDHEKHPEANNYRIGIPVVVGLNGELTIGVDHTYDTSLEGADKSEHGEWVCFDDFELIYLGQRKPNEFVLDETDGINNTYITDYEEFLTPTIAEETDAKGGAYKKLVIRRTLYRDKFMPIVLPISLTKKQVKEGFGDDTKVSKLKGLTGTTIFYEAVPLSGAQTDIAMEAGKPYIIKPSAFPIISADSTYQRLKFPDNYEAAGGGKSPYAGRYVWGETRNKWIDEHRDGKVRGPIYIIDSVLIKKSEVFPNIEKRDENAWKYAVDYGANVDNIYKTIDKFQPQNPVQVVGDNSGKTYKLTAKAYYRPDNSTNGNANIAQIQWLNGIIPNYSYYHAVDGNMYFTGKRTASAKRGFGAYLQLLEQVNGTDGDPQQGAKEIIFSDSWLNGEYFFIEITETTGIKTIEDEKANDDDAWYTLEGIRLDGQPTMPGVYINGGKKKIVK
ncbi:hypothetical protein [Prevotella sp. Rep29]|uniref:hypothetical protein n=1 Tax=Prevotella sp. Rep29 TaxID=2691580 RepID=UPI001C6E47E6|nr:hypothetical protein [Prevotella sp. Rep29]QYR11551.1 hypothetical protein GRF55_10890 [Prevotella sp. Rep29]